MTAATSAPAAAHVAGPVEVEPHTLNGRLYRVEVQRCLRCDHLLRVGDDVTEEGAVLVRRLRRPLRLGRTVEFPTLACEG